jgi:hypothetical protein
MLMAGVSLWLLTTRTLGMPISYSWEFCNKINFTVSTETEAGCDALVEPEHGEVRCPGHPPGRKYPPGAECHIRCSKGHKLDGPHTRHCGEDGRWSGYSPSCVREYCTVSLATAFQWKQQELTGGWRKLINEELCNLYSSSDVVRVIKSRRVAWAEHAACMGKWEMFFTSYLFRLHILFPPFPRSSSVSLCSVLHYPLIYHSIQVIYLILSVLFCIQFSLRF